MTGMDYAQMGMMLAQMMQGQNKNKGLTFGPNNVKAGTPGDMTPHTPDAGVAQLQKAGGMGNSPVNSLAGLGGDEGVDMGYSVAERGGTPWEAFTQEGMGSGMDAMASNPAFGAAMGQIAGSLANSGGDEIQLLGSGPQPTGGSLGMDSGMDAARMQQAQSLMSQLMQNKRAASPTGGALGSRGLSLTGMRY